MSIDFLFRFFRRIFRDKHQNGASVTPRFDSPVDNGGVMDLGDPLTSGPFSIAPPPPELEEELKRYAAWNPSDREWRHVLRSENIPPGEIGTWVAEHIPPNSEADEAAEPWIRLPDAPWE